MVMFGWFRRKPGFQEFAAALNPRRIRLRMTVANKSMHPHEGFERTIVERALPKLSAEIADSQSIKSVRQALRARRSFKGGRK